jgi:serine/threonine protein kinase
VTVDEELRDRLTGAVLDGTRVDWDSLESGVDSHERSLIKHFKTLTGLADVHRASANDGTQPVAVTHGAEAADGYWGHLRLLERIGRGAFGAVYRAWDERLDREVALKLLAAGRAPEGDVGRAIIHEGRLLARV